MSSKYNDEAVNIVDEAYEKYKASKTTNASIFKEQNMNEIIQKAALINAMIGSNSPDWEESTEMKYSDFEESAKPDIDGYVFLKDKNLKAKLGIASDIDGEEEMINGYLREAYFSLDGKEYLPFSHFTEEYTKRKLEEGELLKDGEKAIKDQEKAAKKEEKAAEKEMKALKKEYEVKADLDNAYVMDVVSTLDKLDSDADMHMEDKVKTLEAMKSEVENYLVFNKDAEKDLHKHLEKDGAFSVKADDEDDINENSEIKNTITLKFGTYVPVTKAEMDKLGKDLQGALMDSLVENHDPFFDPDFYSYTPVATATAETEPLPQAITEEMFLNPDQFDKALKVVQNTQKVMKECHHDLLVIRGELDETRQAKMDEILGKIQSIEHSFLDGVSNPICGKFEPEASMEVSMDMPLGNEIELSKELFVNNDEPMVEKEIMVVE